MEQWRVFTDTDSTPTSKEGLSGAEKAQIPYGMVVRGADPTVLSLGSQPTH